MWDHPFPSPYMSVPLYISMSLHLSAFLHISTPPPHLDQCSFYRSLVVALPHSSIFWQFWVILVCSHVVVCAIVVCRGEGCLAMPPFWLEVSSEESFSNKTKFLLFNGTGNFYNLILHSLGIMVWSMVEVPNALSKILRERYVRGI